MSNDDKGCTRATQTVGPITVEAHEPGTDCTIPAPSTTVDTLESTAQEARVRRSSDKKKGTGGLDSLGGGNLP
jgi:hypothetical protein